MREPVRRGTMPRHKSPSCKQLLYDDGSIKKTTKKHAREGHESSKKTHGHGEDLYFDGRKKLQNEQGRRKCQRRSDDARLQGIPSIRIAASLRGVPTIVRPIEGATSSVSVGVAIWSVATCVVAELRGGRPLEDTGRLRCGA